MLIDSHCHLPHEKYPKSISEIISEGKENGVDKYISIGTSVKDNKKVIDVADKYEDVFCSVGIYPHEDKNLSIRELKSSLDDNFKISKRIVAIGECGIDTSNWENGRSLEEQIEVFEMQINLALERNVPIIIHDRNGDESVLKIVNKYFGNGLRGVIHCFDSDWDFAKKVLDLGFYISFSNLISYPKKDRVLEVVKNVPMDRFLVETDAPYLPPQDMRGEINYPKYVRIVAEKVAQVKQKTFDEVSLCSYENTCSFFNI